MMTARMSDAGTIHSIQSAAPEQRLAAAVLDRAIADASFHPDNERRDAAERWLRSPMALWWIAMITPPDSTPQDIQCRALMKALNGRQVA